MNCINNQYLKKESLRHIKQVFSSNTPKSIQLREFLSKEFYIKFQKSLNKLDWKQISIPNKLRYKTADIPKEINEFLNSKDLKDFITAITSINIKKIESRVFSFSHYDYSLLYDELIQSPGLLFILEFTPSWNIEYDGYSSFIQDNEETIRVNPISNSLTLVQQPSNLKYFVKYINHLAKDNKRIFIQGLITGTESS